ncbi:integrator complex subunit 3-like isoform X2 [Acropora millepora]|nr:integrator complex subunit 3-like isoform X2 [Acropora millepora]XP_029204430.1 integrator complex subunit 3-like isoform X2 [Acropora millepora]XP_029204431.1 integrator complex subunit 3-like isoform X2 [Acropora millepora]
MSVISNLSENEAHDALNQMVCKGPQQHEEASLGLLYIILVEPAAALKAFRDLTYITRDGLSLIISRLIGIVTDKLSKLLDTVRIQVIWLSGELLKNSTPGVEGLCQALLRQISGGDNSVSNVWLAENVLGLLNSNRAWLERNPMLLATAVYTFLRLLEDHEAAPLKNLQQMEIEFCVALLREKFSDCIPIGRDLVRLLQNVTRIPEFSALWKDILYKPQSLSPQFTGISQLLYTRTSRKFLACRLHPEMENKILFLTSKVRFGQQKRYQDWFQKQYLSSPESQSLRADLIRYIVGVVHPCNEVLCSDIIPRWAIIGWLLTSCQTVVSTVNAKLALFFDWLFYQPDKDNIMNIEPAILLMHHSIRSHPTITCTLLDFLCRIIPNYSTLPDVQARQGVLKAFRHILSKKVVMSLSPLLDNPKMDRELRMLVRSTLAEFCDSGSKLEESSTSAFSKVESSSSASSSNDILGGSLGSRMMEADTSNTKDSELADSGVDEELEPPEEEAVFSDPDEDDDNDTDSVKPDSDGKEKDYQFKPIHKEGIDDQEERDSNEDVTELEEFESLGDEVKELILKFSQESNVEQRCSLMENILKYITSLDEFEEDITKSLAFCLNFCVVDELLAPCILRDRVVEDCLDGPIYVLCRNICILPTHDVGRERYLTLLGALHNVDHKIGYRFLFFLKASVFDDERLTMYEDFVNASRGEKTLQVCLIEDLRVCQQYDIRAFRYIISSIYKKFPEHVVGNTDILHMLVGNMEPRQLNQLVSEIMLGELTIFGEDSKLDTLLESTLEWESFEQQCVWHLIQAEDVLLESFVNILPSLKQNQHAEALANLLILMKSVSPSMDFLTPMLSMECLEKRPGNPFSVSLLRYWAQECPRELAQLIGQLLCKQASATKKRKNSKNQPVANLELVLCHLDWLHKICQEQEDMHFFKHEGLRSALDQVKQTASDTRKTRFKLLFSLCDDKESRKRTTRASILAANRAASSSSESEEEEEQALKPRNAKRRKKANTVVDSDSDD